MARQMITCESCGKQYDYLKSEACPNCGASLADGAKFCMECGTKL